MKKNTRILLLVILAVVFALGAKLWADKSTIGGDEYSSPPIDPAIELAFDFAHALQRNDLRAYDMIDPNLKPRLDEWMNSHKSRECVRDVDYSLISAGTNSGKMIIFGCFTETFYLDFEVDDIVIKDLKVIDWGEVREGN